MKELNAKQKEALAGKSNEARITGTYKALFDYVEFLLNGEPGTPVAPKVPSITSTATGTNTPSATDKT